MVGGAVVSNFIYLVIAETWDCEDHYCDHITWRPTREEAEELVDKYTAAMNALVVQLRMWLSKHPHYKIISGLLPDAVAVERAAWTQARLAAWRDAIAETGAVGVTENF